MLVLVRKPGEGLVLDYDIVVKILAVSGDRVTVGITAPDDVEVHRDEVFQRIEGEDQ